MAWVALVLGLAASAILGLSAWQGLGAIEFDLSPFTTAKWWGVGLAVAAALPIVAIVLSIVSLVRKANRAVAAVGLILSLFGPAGGLVAGANAGFDSLAHHAADVAREKGATALETIEIDGLPDWLSDLAVAAIRPSD
jgi:hypothetical protein